MIGHEKPSLDEVLEHHGVKGMKWGVRRDPSTGVRPIAQTLNDSKFGQKSIARANSHMDKQRLKTVKVNNRAAVRAVSKQHTIVNPSSSQIRQARAKLDVHNDDVARARAKYKTSKAQYKIDKQVIGKTQAKLVLEKNGKLTLQKAKARRDANYDVASRETSDEAVSRIIRQILS